MKGTLPTRNPIASLIMGFVCTGGARPIVEIDEPHARRRIRLLYREDAPDKVLSPVKYMKAHALTVSSGDRSRITP